MWPFSKPARRVVPSAVTDIAGLVASIRRDNPNNAIAARLIGRVFLEYAMARDPWWSECPEALKVEMGDNHVPEISRMLDAKVDNFALAEALLACAVGKAKGFLTVMRAVNPELAAIAEGVRLPHD